MRLPSNYRYFDFAAGWPVQREALDVYVHAVRQYGNPGSVHQAGQRALASLDASRASLASQVGCDPKEIIFTSSATEANNLAIVGTVAAFKREHPGVVPVVAISAIEHDAVRVPAEHLAESGEVELVVIPVDAEKGIDLKAIESVLGSRTALISVMHVSNETGTVLPIERVARLVKDYRDDGVWPRLHSDAAQALAYVEELATSHADLVTYSGYKVGSVAGVAALVVRGQDHIEGMVLGGGQEYGIRSGTEDVAAVASFAKAVEVVRGNTKAEIKRVVQLKKNLITALAQTAPRIEENTSALEGAPHIVSLWVRDTHAQQTLTRLDLAGFAVAAGPACSTRSLEPSRVLQAFGYSKQRAGESVRISFGPETTEDDVVALAEALAA